MPFEISNTFHVLYNSLLHDSKTELKNDNIFHQYCLIQQLHLKLLKQFYVNTFLICFYEGIQTVQVLMNFCRVSLLYLFFCLFSQDVVTESISLRCRKFSNPDIFSSTGKSKLQRQLSQDDCKLRRGSLASSLSGNLVQLYNSLTSVK